MDADDSIDAGIPAFMQQVRHRIDRRQRSGVPPAELSEIVLSMGLDPGRQGLISSLFRKVHEFTSTELKKQGKNPTNDPLNAVESVECLLQSPEFRNFKDDLIHRVQDSVAQVVSGATNVNPNLYQRSSHDSLWRMNTGRSDSILSNSLSGRQSVSSNDEFNLNSSFSGDLPTGPELSDVLADLQPTTTPEDKLQALRDLAKYDPSELLHTESWDELQAILSELMQGLHADVAHAVVVLYSRMFHGRSEATKEVYTAVSSHLVRYFRDGRAASVVSQSIIEAHGRAGEWRIRFDSIPTVVAVIYQVQALQNFNRELPKYWVRFGERCLEPIVDDTMQLLRHPLPARLLTIRSDTERPGRKFALKGKFDGLTACHLMALSDPNARWFTEWMRGHFCRRKLIAWMQQAPNMLRGLAAHVLAGLQWQRQHAAGAARTRIDPEADVHPDTPTADEHVEYTVAHLRYLHLVHAISLVGTIMMYREGWNLFPIQFTSGDVIESGDSTDPVGSWWGMLDAVTATERNGTITVGASDLIAELIRAMCDVELHRAPQSRTGGRSARWHQPVGATHDSGIPALSFRSAVAAAGSDTVENNSDINVDLSSVIASTLRALPQTIMTDLMLTESTMNQLLIPFRRELMVRRSIGATLPIATVMVLTDLFAQIASTPRGRDVLVQPLDASQSQESPADVLARYLLRCVDKTLSVTDDVAVNRAIHVLMVIRLLYSTYSGVWLLERYHLDRCLTTATRHVAPCTPSPTSLLWERHLVDGLLHLASTPRGMHRLERTGDTHVSRAALFMFERFQQKLQVGKYEKFGYGVLVMQFCATTVGMQALCDTRFVSSCIACLLDPTDAADSTGPGPEPSSMSPAKAASYCLKMFSCFEGVRTALYHTSSPPTPARIPVGCAADNVTDYEDGSLAKMIHQLVLCPSVAEQGHVRGLKILHTIVGCLDSMVLLEHTFGVIDHLLRLQAACRIASSGESAGANHGATAALGPVAESFILDPSSLARNRLLVAMCTVGGGSERVLPPITEPHTLPLFARRPCPAVYIGTTPPPALGVPTVVLDRLDRIAESGDAQSVLRETIRVMGEQHTESAGADGVLPGTETRQRLTKLLGNIVVALVASWQGVESIPAVKFPVEGTALASDLQGPWAVGFDVAAQYASALQLFPTKQAHTDAMQGLRTVLCTTWYGLAHERGSVAAGGAPSKDNFRGFDWFTATITLMLGGDVAKATSLLQRLSSCDSAAYVWYSRLAVGSATKQNPNTSHPLYHNMAFVVERIVSKHLPGVANAFRLNGFTVSHICLNWLRQCFWNFLDWPEVMHYTALALARGPAYQACCCVALLQFLQPVIMEHTQEESLVEFINTHPIVGFRWAEHLDLIDTLLVEYPVDEKDFALAT
eukprot:m.1056825 g.1056825  ORF g.1056825 m.1056825 type:complete len:1390 (+) comp24201_c1_seq2:82-4251(+)